MGQLGVFFIVLFASLYLPPVTSFKML